MSRVRIIMLTGVLAVLTLLLFARLCWVIVALHESFITSDTINPEDQVPFLREFMILAFSFTISGMGAIASGIILFVKWPRKGRESQVLSASPVKYDAEDGVERQHDHDPAAGGPDRHLRRDV
jgi:purine-cytosine permease-like protein